MIITARIGVGGFVETTFAIPGNDWVTLSCTAPQWAQLIAYLERAAR